MKPEPLEPYEPVKGFGLNVGWRDVAFFPLRLLSTVVYVACAWFSFRIPEMITSYDGPTRTLHLWWRSVDLTRYEQEFTLYPAAMLVTFAIFAYLDTAHPNVRALVIASAAAGVNFGFWFLALLLFIALDSDNHDFDGNVVARHISIDSWLMLAFASVPGLVYCGYSYVHRLRQLRNVDGTPRAATWWRFFRMGALPTVALAICAASLHVTR